ncbi:vesicle transport protein SEC20 [Gadus morhua]|uniref:BCL2 interacting protein 1 n=2 Tax=Gadus TaxID=8048 RepID=A0A8C5BTE2_GADMO|nr:vesicle transport protein SEC20-like [Gadus morhua]
MFRKRIKDLVHESNLISGLHACRSRSGTTNQPANMACLDVHVRICEQEILKYDLEIKALVQDVRECTGPQSTLTELNSKVIESFQNLRLRIQDLEQMGLEQDKESDKQALLQQVEGHRKQMISNQIAWRKANLTSKMSIDALEKEALLNGDDALRKRKKTKGDLTQTSSDITESLMSMSRMMAQQVEQSEDTMTTLATSSKSVQETNEEFKAMTGTIQLGRKLITKYNRRELTDKLLIFLALALFFSTVLYIVKKRLFPFL